MGVIPIQSTTAFSAPDVLLASAITVAKAKHKISYPDSKLVAFPAMAEMILATAAPCGAPASHTAPLLLSFPRFISTLPRIPSQMDFLCLYSGIKHCFWRGPNHNNWIRSFRCNSGTEGSRISANTGIPVWKKGKKSWQWAVSPRLSAAHGVRWRNVTYSKKKAKTQIWLTALHGPFKYMIQERFL